MEYDPAYVDEFIALADAIEAAFPSVLVEGNEQEDGRAGSFEISTSDGVHIFSRLQSAAMPDADAVINRIANRARLRQGAGAGDGPACG